MNYRREEESARETVAATEKLGRRARACAASVDSYDEDQRMVGRACQPEDVANAVRFFVSERASYVTGEKLSAYGGGQEMRRS